MKSHQRTMSYKKIIALAIAVLVGGGILYYALAPINTVVDFDYGHDGREIQALFKRDWYWLVAAPERYYDLDFVLRYKAVHQDISTAGCLQIKVLRENNEFKGFVAYYIEKNPKIGCILFLSVKDDVRRKGYGERLARYAIDDLFAQGCTKIDIVTRPSNERALNLYKNKLGFKETHRDDDFVSLEFIKNT